MYRASRDLQEQIGRMSTAVQEDLAGAAGSRATSPPFTTVTTPWSASGASPWRARCAPTGDTPGERTFARIDQLKAKHGIDYDAHDAYRFTEKP